jgi:flagella synthesis protein FlgN
MKASEALARMLRDLQADRSGYMRLRELLDAQFQAALRHQAPALVGLAEEITALVGELEARRASRSELLARLLGRGVAPSLSALLPRLPAQVGQTVTQAWQALEQQVQECKRMNLRNCQLITEQHALMQRALGIEEQGYAQP